MQLPTIHGQGQRNVVLRARFLPLALATVAAAFLLMAGVPAAGGPGGMSGTWTLIFSDGFNGRSIDRSKWEPTRYGVEHGGDAPFVPSADDAWFSSRNVAVRDGRLAITIRRESKTLSGMVYRFSSGVLQSQQHYLVKPPVYIEARIKVPKCAGCWPAFWLAAPKRWPPEMDIAEFFGTGSNGRPSFNYHPPERPAIGPVKYGERRIDYTAAYHVYGMLWDGYKAVPYLDGQAYPLGEGFRSDITRLPQALILNLSVQAGRNPAGGSQMLVDWVHAWRPGAST